MNRGVPGIVAIAVAIAVVGLAVVLRDLVAPFPPTGPLALVEPQVGSGQARTEGVLEITDDCVRLIHPDGDRSLVIWVRGSVSWNATDRSVVVSRPDGGGLALRDGDAVVLGGGGGLGAELERAGFWFRRPREDCSEPQWFLVADVQLAAEN